jgi:hypothetical protein
MNSDTGKSYSGVANVTAALQRGEKLIEISSKAAVGIAICRRARSVELRKKRSRQRRRDAIAKASRRGNRR